MSDQFALPPGATPVTAGDRDSGGGVATAQQFALPPGATAVEDTSAKAPDFSVKAAVLGPNTALATPVSPEWKSEASGVSDILHGNFREGASKIYEAEKPHVIQGSWLEKTIQKINPDFQGGVTAPDAAAHNAQYFAPGRPLADASQFIDKEQHPVQKAVAETAESLTSPGNIAILLSTGGLGLVDNPASLRFASRLISGGFSAAAIANAYKNYKGFREALDAGNWSEAAYQITHAVTSGVLGALAARGAVTEKPLLKNPFDKTGAAPASVGAAIATLKALPIETAVTDAAAKSPISAGSPATVAPSGELIQPNLQSGVRAVVNDAAVANGFQPIPDTVSIRNVAKALGDQAHARSQATFDAAEKITGINFTALKQNIFKLDDQISDLAISDPERAGVLQQQKLSYENQAEAGLKAAAKKGVDVKQARSDWNLQLRANELSNHVRSSAEGTQAEPTLNPTKLTPRLQKMNEAEVGQKTPKLAQLFGDDLANNLVSHAERARAATTEIKDFEPTGPTGQKALEDILRPNTGTGPIQSRWVALGLKPSPNWLGAFRDFNKLSPTERATQFGSDAPQAYQFLKGQAKLQIIKNIAKAGSIAALGHAAGVDTAILHFVLGE